MPSRVTDHIGKRVEPGWPTGVRSDQGHVRECRSRQVAEYGAARPNLGCHPSGPDPSNGIAGTPTLDQIAWTMALPSSGYV